MSPNHGRLLFAVIIPLLTSACATTGSPVANDVWSAYNYELSCEAVGTRGVQTLVVASFGRDVEDALVFSRRNAVHGLLFKGVRTSVCNVPPLVPSYEAYAKHESWYVKFFGSDAGYVGFVASASDVPSDMVYVGKNVKVYSNVVVNRNALRDFLIEQGLISRMGDVFQNR